MATTRRIGAETSKSRAKLLDVTAQLMLDRGYAGVTYRQLAAAAGVAPSLVQYYFPTLDDLFIALLRGRSARSLKQLQSTLRERPDEPIRVVWEFSADQISAALLVEFMALANHRKSIRAEIAAAATEWRRVALEAIAARWDETRPPFERLTPTALLFLLAGMPKMLSLERAVGVSMGHQETLVLVEAFIDQAEPRLGDRARPVSR